MFTVLKNLETGDVHDHLWADWPGSAHTKKCGECGTRLNHSKHLLQTKNSFSRDEFGTKKLLCVLIKKLGLRAYKRYTTHLLDTRLRHLQLERLKNLLCVYGKNLFKAILFADEKIFTIELKFSK